MASSFSLSLTLKKEPEHDAIYFKQDGERFTSSHTVKLNVNTNYTVQIAIRPAHELVGQHRDGRKAGRTLGKPKTILWLLEDLPTYSRRGSQHELDFNAQRPHCTASIRTNHHYIIGLCFRGAVIRGERCEPKLSKEDENGIIYHLNWSTQGLELNKKGNRIEIPIVLEVKHHGPFKTTLQCKLYKDQEKVHSKWGQNLSSIVYECKIGDAGSHVDIVKERYL